MVLKESTLTYRWFSEVWNKGNVILIEEMLDENVRIYGLDIDTQGKEQFRNFYDEFNESFKDIHVEIEFVIRENEYEAAVCKARATQRFTGREVSFSGMVMVKIKDGKVIEAWNNFDFLSMYLQLGQKLV